MAKKKSAKKKAAKKKSSGKKSAKKGAQKNSLVANINRRKRAGTSRSKEKSTVQPTSYKKMKQGWGKGKKRKGK